jgi:starvation-inducible DNA-binding protein
MERDMPIKGLKDNAVKTSVAQLNARLADMLALKLALKQAHWNVKGPAFIAVHELLDAVAGRVDDASDTMAERVQVLGGVALGTVETVAKAATVKPYPTDLVKETDHVQAICARIADLGAKMREAITDVTDAGDDGTADIFVGVSRQLDKDLWFLESHLGK